MVSVVLFAAANVVVPVTVRLLEKVLSPVNDCVPVFTNPLVLLVASGIVRVCVLTELVNPNVPDVGEVVIV